MASSTVFISYRREDSAGHAGRLFDRLAGKLGRDRVFRDVDNIRPGEDFTDVVRERIHSSEVLFVLIGPRWLTATDADGARRLDDPNDTVRLEIETGLQGKIRVIPVLLPGATMPKTKDLPGTLAPLVKLNAYEVSETHFDQDVLKLLGEVKAPLWVTMFAELKRRPIYVVAAAILLAGVITVPVFRSHREALVPQSATSTSPDRDPSDPAVLRPAVSPTMTPDQARDQLGRLGLSYNSDAFIGAASNGDLTAVSLFLRAGMRPDAGSPDAPSALEQALDEGHPDVARVLIEAGANVERSLRAVARDGDEQLFNLLLSKKPDQQALAAALYEAAGTGHINLVKELLDRGIGPNDRWGGNLPLESAAYAGRTEVVKLLLARGADVNAVDKGSGGEGETALHYAARSGATDVVGLLLSAGASVNVQDKEGTTPLMDGVAHRQITMMLLENKANVNLRDEAGRTALMLAAGQHLTSIIKLIVDKGADINAQDKRGWTPLMFTSGAIDSVDDPETVQTVLDNGGDPNKQDAGGYTALMYAAGKGLNGAVRVLLAAGANRDKKNKEGQTALQLATASSAKHVMEMLKK